MSRECTQLSFWICKETGAKLGNEQMYKHEPKSVAANYGSEVTILWNKKINSDTTIPNNKPDIIRDDEKGTYLTIDAAESGNIIMIKKEPNGF
jgi:hypothetical protein